MSFEPPEGPSDAQQPSAEWGMPSEDARMWAMLSHLGGLIGYVFPLGNIVAPLVVWLIKKDEMPFVDNQGKESINFQISITIYTLISAVLIIALIGFPLVIAVTVFDLVMLVIAAVKSNQGIAYRYPLCIRFIK